MPRSAWLTWLSTPVCRLELMVALAMLSGVVQSASILIALRWTLGAFLAGSLVMSLTAFALLWAVMTRVIHRCVVWALTMRHRSHPHPEGIG